MRVKILLFLFPALSFSLQTTLKNGAKIIVERKQGELSVICAYISSGSIYEAEYTGTGISHFVEHLLFKGGIADRIEELGGEISGSTSFDKTVYKILIHREKAEKALELLKEALFSPQFRKADIENERGVILAEISAREDDPERYIGKMLFATAYREHPVRHPIIGYRELFLGLDRDDLLAYHRRMYIPENLLIVTVGSFTESLMCKKIERIFSDLKREAIIPIAIPKESAQIAKRRFYKERDIEMCYLKIAWHIPDITHPHLYPLDLLAVILGQGATSRLNLSLKEEKQLVFSTSAYSFTPRWGGLFIVSAQLPKENIDRVIEAIDEEIEKIKREGVKEAELSKAKRMLSAELLFLRETQEGLAEDLASSFYTTGDPHFSEKYLERIEAVKPDDVKKVAQIYLKEENSTEAILAPFGTVQREEEMEVSVQKIKRYILPNGLKLLIGTERQTGILSICALFKAGRRVEDDDKAGISHILSQLLLKGTKKKSAEEIAGFIESLGGSISSYSGRNSLGISIHLLADNCREGIELLAEILKEPKFSEEEIEKEKREAQLAIKRKRDDPFSACFELLLSTLFTRHPYRIPEYGTEEGIESITRDDIMGFYYNWIRPNNMVLSVFGDIDEEEVLSGVKEQFGSWMRDPSLEVLVDIVQEPPVEKMRRREKKKDVAQSVIMLGFLGTTVHSPDRYKLELLSTILSRQGGRLFRALREEEGLCYYCGSFNILGIDPGAFVVYCGTDKGNIESVIDKIKAEISDIQKNGVSEDELSSARNYLLGQKALRYDKFSNYGFDAGLYELYGIEFSEIERFSEVLEGITPSSVKEAASLYLSLESATLAILGP
jgi:zinc protease